MEKREKHVVYSPNKTLTLTYCHNDLISLKMATRAVVHSEIVAPPTPDNWKPHSDAGAKISGEPDLIINK
jgi:hypothetical protein